MNGNATKLKVTPVDILLVDDNDDDVVLFKEAFEEAHLINIVAVVHDGEQALAYLRRRNGFENAPRPGLVLLDINMPKKNGLEVLEEMKSDPDLRSLPVVMLTVSNREEDVVRSYSNGACSYIRKPVDISQLHEVAKGFSLYWALVSEIPGRRRQQCES